ncbi:MAG: M81 family metallopeptidase [Candidatus Latescibacterota bacterium]|jgi:microcystin degradation protein MlrC
MRIGIAKVMQETSTFSTQPTDLAMFEAHGIARGQAVLTRSGVRDEFLDGFFAETAGHELVGVTRVEAMPAGNLTRQAQETILEWFAEDLRAALPLDGLLLNLHGAFAGEADPDLDGLVLATARQILGPQVPIGVALDLHANISGRMVETSNLVDGMHTHPHVDMRATGQRVARALLAALQGKVRPVISAVKIPMVTPAETQISTEPPLRDLMAATRRHEEDPRVLLASVFAVQPWMDVPEMGWCSVVVTDNDRDLADRLARDLAGLAWEQRRDYTQPCPSYTEALDQAFASDLRPVVIADLTDLMTGGGTGDSTWFLKELLARRPEEPCYLPMVDPAAAQDMATAGPGAQVTLSLGGKLDHVNSTPVEVTGEVVRVIPVVPGRELPESMGLTAVLRLGQVYVVVFERLGPGADPVIYRGAGLDPGRAKVLVAKSVVDFREGYREVARLFLLGEAPGLAPANLLSLRWERVPRPLFPLDPEMSWDPATAPLYRSR